MNDKKPFADLKSQPENEPSARAPHAPSCPRDSVTRKLVFALGPPDDKQLRPLFDQLQEWFKEGGPRRESDREAYERDVTAILSDRRDRNPSHFDEIFSSVLGVSVRMTKPFTAIGTFRGQAVAVINFPEPELLRPAAAGLLWPPDRERCTRLAASIGSVLQREWVHWWVISEPSGWAASACREEVPG